MQVGYSRASAVNLADAVAVKQNMLELLRLQKLPFSPAKGDALPVAADAVNSSEAGDDRGLLAAPLAAAAAAVCASRQACIRSHRDCKESTALHRIAQQRTQRFKPGR